ncbi:hypothetical protein ACFCXK_33520 [Streptomyces sp. NPDC056269]|uniref:hypothetical protein n=1 Tax=Streptomyces sp. NPDC056269 TaxID=3345768 RepID=UPI0035DDA225
MRPILTRGAGLGALVTAVVLALVPLPQDPSAAAATGPSRNSAPSQNSALLGNSAPAQDSAVTKRGTKGPYDDFSTLEVTVHQTRNLRSQGLSVTWKGGRPTQGRNTDYLQIMQCWGDDPAGPRREQCQLGAGAKGSDFGAFIGSRLLPVGSDPLEKQYGERIPDPEYPGQTTDPFVPFTPVSGPATTKPTDWTYFSPGDSNEEFFATTQPDGTGETGFNLQSTREAPHLGCGDPVGSGANARGRGCWLVVVPRGSHDPDGTTGRPVTSAFSTTNWNQRIVFPLGFLPVREPCPTDKAERRMTGSELVTDALTSWQSSLCADGSTRFTFTQRGEDLARGNLLNPTSTSPGLAFTVEPVDGGEKAGFVHAPVAVNGLTVGLYWEADRIGLVKDLRLNPRLLAKLLTGSYPYDVRLLTDKAPVPDHLKGNPESILRDPEFLALNPRFKEFQQSVMNYPGGILLSADRSDSTRIVWNYLRADRDARAFLEGDADPWGMRINRYFKDLGLASAGSYEFPKADPTETKLVEGELDITYGMVDRSPYAIDLHDAARAVRRGTNGAKDRAAPDTATGGLKLTGGDVPPGSRRAYGITDAASAARYQLQIAALPNADGTYVHPTAAAMLKAVDQFEDSAVPGVLTPDPARARNGAYPLTVVTYAAASTGLPADARRDYARVLRYAAGPGQKQGTAPGELPLGYAPMPAKLKARAAAAADRLERGAPTGPGSTTGGAGGGSTAGAGGSSGGPDSGGGQGASGSTGSTGTAPGGSGGAASGGGSASGTDTGGSAGTPSSAAPPPPSGGSTGGPGGAPGEELAGTGSTPSQVLGAIRWVLLSVLVAGGLAGVAGPAVLAAARRRIPSDSPRTGIRNLKSG